MIIELFDKLTLDLLNDSLTYDYLDYDPLLSIKNDINDTLLRINVENKFISNRLLKLLVVENCLPGNIRILPKIHKTKFSLRPTFI